MPPLLILTARPSAIDDGTLRKNSGSERSVRWGSETLAGARLERASWQLSPGDVPAGNERIVANEWFEAAMGYAQAATALARTGLTDLFFTRIDQSPNKSVSKML